MKKILVIEDETPIRETILDILELADYDFRDASNGIDGVRIAKEYIPDLIVCDVMMPDLDGYGVLLELQQTSSTARIPFIFLTAKASREDIRKGMTMGADDYLTKPFTSREILDAIENRLKKFDMLAGHATRETQAIRNYLNTTLPHELRTPLSGIIGYLNLLQADFEYLKPDDVQMILRRMDTSANRLYSLVENYLLNAHLQVLTHDNVLLEKVKEYSVCTDPDAILHVIAEQKSFHYKRVGDLDSQVANGIVPLYSDNLKKVCEEVIDNAFKFSTEGTPVTVRGYAEGKYYHIEVTDKGRGMSKEEIDSIGANQQFDRETYEQQGAGLGLEISRKIVTLFGGEFRVRSEPNKFTTVTILLPLVEGGTYTDILVNV